MKKSVGKETKSHIRSFIKTALQGKNKFFLAGGIVFIFLLLFLNGFIHGKKRIEGLISYEVKRQGLVISVVEGGNLKALRSQKIINEVPGQRNILEVIDEGILITEKDVQDSKILMKLDSKDLDDRAEELRITVENSLSSYTQAQQNLEIQKKQNDSDIIQAELNVKFAKIDLEKYLGEKLAGELIINESENINFSKLIANPQLEGEALNKKRELENSIDLSKEEVARAKDRVQWSEKLSEKEYITKSELDADRFSLQQQEASSENSKLGYQLFLDYDFPKQVALLLSNYQESLRELDKTKAKCGSEIIKAESYVRSSEAAYLGIKNNLSEAEQNIVKCTIRATQPGLVVYATSSNPWRSQNPIQPGTTVYDRQDLLNLPDFSSMGVEVKIHESSIEKIKVGQKVLIKVDACSGNQFTGEVKKVAPLPDATFKWMNPDLNVYLVEISLDKNGQNFDCLKPGLSAEVEIMIEKLENVLVVPLAVISQREGKSTCAVLRGSRIDIRKIELGSSSEDMVEVKSGLKEREIVVILSGEMGEQVKKTPMAETGKFKSEETENMPTEQPPTTNTTRPENSGTGRPNR
ncbi:MAG: HlyD family efflux transporter periplasmic adaptor subunit [Candidatus Omnitrophica bacterium]|nr:HlyD family efflux transporter periplasmic adaptor subunit [Candidatus Omnitrophota bacterium]MBU1047758.1 HlyD family efflux transporter periplasmic adaptor subunit [Candidatus Omnitrophota bacterium]MBU1631073.1 HlyD family efflux transporter periplasmic adaptor subunit [Candidatus Omnitrophota bacterium]MBU1766964.1 HlyD family efflux transporter periplasmic adaptor subunit [Candidatus Omnitrophota bacterium]MBU1889341.1 HlyD family efflux transporter periplasmic adaptor subunit [Candidat